MKRWLMSAWAVWCAALIVVSGALVAHLVTWPAWTDTFWSSWAQTVGSLAAIGAALQVGRSQVRAAETLHRRAVHDEWRVTLRLASQAVRDALGYLENLVDNAMYKPGGLFHDLALAQLEAAEQLLAECLHRKMPRECFDDVRNARNHIRTLHAAFTHFKSPVPDSARPEVVRRGLELKAFGEALTAAEAKLRDDGSRRDD
jgi:hypothetical protein